jgi:hypothetical protein
MGTSENQTWGNAPVGIFTVLLIIFLIWAFSGDRHFFRHIGNDLKASVQDAGHDLKESGRDVADSIRRTAQ